jgi:hypothetical protein
MVVYACHFGRWAVDISNAFQLTPAIHASGFFRIDGPALVV